MTRFDIDIAHNLFVFEQATSNVGAATCFIEGRGTACKETTSDTGAEIRGELTTRKKAEYKNLWEIVC